MKTRISLTIVLSLLTHFLIIAQTGPAGVGTNDGTSNLIMWYRTDQGLSATGSNIASWSNDAGYTEHLLSQNGSIDPQLLTATANGYDEIKFDASTNDGTLQTAMNLTTSNFVVDDVSLFIVLKTDVVTPARPYSTEPLQPNRFSSHIPFTDSNAYFDMGTCCGTNNRIVANGVTPVSSNSIWSFDGNATDGRDIYRNGNLLRSLANVGDFSGHNSHSFSLGYNFNGSMTEVIIFNQKINEAQRIIIQNYLSAKYNISLTNDDLYDEDNTANGNFDHDVSGIGQATDGSNHTDSRGTGIVSINTPSALSNGDYLFWGEETRNPIYNFSTNTSNYTEQLNSRWRVSKVNDLGTVSISFDITNVDLTGKLSCSPLQLVVDNNNDFTSPTSYDLTITGNTATATGISFTDGDYFTLRYVEEIVWNGTAFFNGSGAGNAPDNTNECFKLTVMSGSTASLTLDAHVSEVQIDNGATLNVADGELLEVENNLEINGTLELLGEAQLIQNHTGTTSNSGTGAIRIRQQGSTNLFNYNYWSSPVNVSGTWQVGYLRDTDGIVSFHSAIDADPNTSPITLSSYWLYSFNATSEDYFGWNSISTTTDISPGTGYTMKGSGATGSEQEYIFRGIPNDGNYSYAVTANNDFLIGNPYPSTLDADQFINDNSSVIDGTLYFWEHFNSNSSHFLADYEGGYATYNLTMGVAAVADNSGLTSGNGSASKAAPTQFINVGQGFFVTIQNSGNLVFNNQQRAFAQESLNETVYYRNNESSNRNSNSTDLRTKIWFTLEEPGERLKTIGLGYDSNASYGYDNGYDGRAYDDLRNDFYWLLESNKLIIQGLPAFDVDDEIALGIKVTDAGNYTFGISDMKNFPDDTPIYLKDNLLDTYHDLKLGDHQIVLDTNTDEQRFSIVFKESEALSLDEESVLNSLRILYNKNSNEIVIKNPRNLNIEELSLYNILGQSVLNMKDKIYLNIDAEPLQHGIYIVKIKTDTDTLEKRIIKY